MEAEDVVGRGGISASVGGVGEVPALPGVDVL